MQRDESIAWLRSGAPALVVRLLRAVGLAPLVYGARGVRVSRALSLYGKFLVTISIALLIFFIAVDVPDIINATNVSSITLAAWILQFITALVVLLLAGYFSSHRMEMWLQQVRKIEMAKNQLGDHSRSKAEKTKELTLVVGAILILIFILTGVNYLKFLESNVAVIYIMLDAGGAFLLNKIIEMQLLLTYWYIISLMASFNKSLEELVRAVDEHNRAEVVFQDNPVTLTNNIFPRNALVSPRSINRVIDMMGVLSFANPQSSGMAQYASYLSSARKRTRFQKWKTKGLLASSETKAHSGRAVDRKRQNKIRQLNTIYQEICDQVNTISNGIDGIVGFLIILCSAINLIVTLHNFINTLHTKPLSTMKLALDMLWFLFNFIDINMIMAPGHRIIDMNERVRFLVGQLMGKMHLCSDEVCEELYKLLTSLMLIQPVFSPLGIITLSRSLLLSIFSIVVTYLVILEQFRSAE